MDKQDPVFFIEKTYSYSRNINYVIQLPQENFILIAENYLEQMIGIKRPMTGEHLQWFNPATLRKIQSSDSS